MLLAPPPSPASFPPGDGDSSALNSLREQLQAAKDRIRTLEADLSAERMRLQKLKGARDSVRPTALTGGGGGSGRGHSWVGVLAAAGHVMDLLLVSGGTWWHTVRVNL